LVFDQRPSPTSIATRASALRKRLIAGKLAPAVECMLWWYAKGKPTERLDLGADQSLAELILASYRPTGDAG